MATEKMVTMDVSEDASSGENEAGVGLKALAAAAKMKKKAIFKTRSQRMRDFDAAANMELGALFYGMDMKKVWNVRCRAVFRIAHIFIQMLDRARFRIKRMHDIASMDTRQVENLATEIAKAAKQLEISGELTGELLEKYSDVIDGIGEVKILVQRMKDTLNQKEGTSESIANVLKMSFGFNIARGEDAEELLVMAGLPKQTELELRDLQAFKEARAMARQSIVSKPKKITRGVTIRDVGYSADHHRLSQEGLHNQITIPRGVFTEEKLNRIRKRDKMSMLRTSSIRALAKDVPVGDGDSGIIAPVWEQVGGKLRKLLAGCANLPPDRMADMAKKWLAGLGYLVDDAWELNDQVCLSKGQVAAGAGDSDVIALLMTQLSPTDFAMELQNLMEGHIDDISKGLEGIADAGGDDDAAEVAAAEARRHMLAALSVCAKMEICSMQQILGLEEGLKGPTLEAMHHMWREQGRPRRLGSMDWMGDLEIAFDEDGTPRDATAARRHRLAHSVSASKEPPRRLSLAGMQAGEGVLSPVPRRLSQEGILRMKSPPTSGNYSIQGTPGRPRASAGLSTRSSPLPGLSVEGNIAPGRSGMSVGSKRGLLGHGLAPGPVGAGGAGGGGGVYGSRTYIAELEDGSKRRAIRFSSLYPPGHKGRLGLALEPGEPPPHYFRPPHLDFRPAPPTAPRAAPTPQGDWPQYYSPIDRVNVEVEATPPPIPRRHVDEYISALQEREGGGAARPMRTFLRKLAPIAGSPSLPRGSMSARTPRGVVGGLRGVGEGGAAGSPRGPAARWEVGREGSHSARPHRPSGRPRGPLWDTASRPRRALIDPSFQDEMPGDPYVPPEVDHGRVWPYAGHPHLDPLDPGFLPPAPPEVTRLCYPPADRGGKWFSLDAALARKRFEDDVRRHRAELAAAAGAGGGGGEGAGGAGEADEGGFAEDSYSGGGGGIQGPASARSCGSSQAVAYSARSGRSVGREGSLPTLFESPGDSREGSMGGPRSGLPIGGRGGAAMVPPLVVDFALPKSFLPRGTPRRHILSATKRPPLSGRSAGSHATATSPWGSSPGLSAEASSVSWGAEAGGRVTRSARGVDGGEAGGVGGSVGGGGGGSARGSKGEGGYGGSDSARARLEGHRTLVAPAYA